MAQLNPLLQHVLQAASQVSAMATVSSQGLTRKDPFPKRVFMCLLARFSSLKAPPPGFFPGGPLHPAFHKDRKQARRKERVPARVHSQDGSHSHPVTNLIMEVVNEVTQSCPALCDPVGYSLSGSSVQKILQARILEWVAIFLFRGSSQPKDSTQVSHIAGRFFTS